MVIIMRNKNRLGLTKREAHAGIVFVGPAVILFVFIRLVPTIYAFFLSFTQFNMVRDPVWVGLGNYAKMIGDNEFFISLQNTLIYTFFNGLNECFISISTIIYCCQIKFINDIN